ISSFGTAACRAGTRHETVVRGSVRPVDVRHYRRVPGRGGTRDASWRARWKGPRGESRRALRLGTRHQQSRRYRQQALTPLRLTRLMTVTHMVVPRASPFTQGPQIQSLLVRDSAALEMPRVDISCGPT